MSINVIQNMLNIETILKEHNVNRSLLLLLKLCCWRKISIQNLVAIGMVGYRLG